MKLSNTQLPSSPGTNRMTINHGVPLPRPFPSIKLNFSWTVGPWRNEEESRGDWPRDRDESKRGFNDSRKKERERWVKRVARRLWHRKRGSRHYFECESGRGGGRAAPNRRAAKCSKGRRVFSNDDDNAVFARLRRGPSSSHFRRITNAAGSLRGTRH